MIFQPLTTEFYKWTSFVSSVTDPRLHPFPVASSNLEFYFYCLQQVYKVYFLLREASDCDFALIKFSRHTMQISVKISNDLNKSQVMDLITCETRDWTFLNIYLVMLPLK